MQSLPYIGFLCIAEWLKFGNIVNHNRFDLIIFAIAAISQYLAIKAEFDVSNCSQE